MNRRDFVMRFVAAVSILIGWWTAAVPATASAGEAWQSVVLTYLRDSQAPSAGEINKILLRHTYSIQTLPQYLHSPGIEFGAAVRDLDRDGKSDVVISRIQSTKQMTLYIFTSSNQWKPQAPVLFALPIGPRLAREVRVLFLDMNNDGVEDIIVRILDGAQRAQSSDCVAVMPSPSVAKTVTRCFKQDQAAEEAGYEDQYVFKGVQERLYQYSHVSDLEGDGRYEMINVQYFIPKKDCGRACWSFWPDVYAWDGKSFRSAGKEHPEFYKRFRAFLDQGLKRGEVPSDQRNTHHEMIRKIDALLKK
jgi:hypothetical protein